MQFNRLTTIVAVSLVSSSILVSPANIAVANPITLPTLAISNGQATQLLAVKQATRQRIQAFTPDLTGDGIPDVLTAKTSTDLEAHAGTGTPDGAGAFATSTKIGTLPTDRRWMGQADLNGDGHNDVMSLSTDGKLYFAANSGTLNGPNTLLPDKLMASGWQSASLLLFTDFLGKDQNNPTELDGLADILFRTPTENSIHLYVNQGVNADGNITFFSWGKLLNNAQAVTSMTTADVTADGFPEFYMTFTDGSTRLMDLFAEQDGNGNWVAKWYTLQATGAATYDTQLLHDVNNDGFPDLVTRTKADGTLAVALHTRNWNPASPSQVFDTAHRKTLANGWMGYRFVA